MGSAVHPVRTTVASKNAELSTLGLEGLESESKTSRGAASIPAPPAKPIDAPYEAISVMNEHFSAWDAAVTGQEDGLVSDAGLEHVAKHATDERQRQAAQYLLSHRDLLGDLDIEAFGEETNQLYGQWDVDLWLARNGEGYAPERNPLDASSAAIVARMYFEEWEGAGPDGKSDGLLDKTNLEAIAGDANRPADQRYAARYLLDHPEHFARLDTAGGSAAPNGLVDTRDLDAFLGPYAGRVPPPIPEVARVPPVPGAPFAVGAPAYNLLLDLSHRPLQPYSLTPQPNQDAYPFRTGSTPAEHVRVEYADGTHIDVYRPVGSTGLTAEDVAQAFARLPRVLRENVDQINLEPNASGTALAEAPWGDKTIHIYPGSNGLSRGQLAGMLAHEAGHAYINEKFAANTPPWTDYQAAMGSDANKPSPYSEASPFEDFSEAVELYLAVRGTPLEAAYRAALPARFAFLDSILA